MEHKPIEQLTSVAEVVQVRGVDLTRRERLQRWADTLMTDPRRALSALRNLEFKSRAERRTSRADNSPLSVAFADSFLRSAGLQGETVGEIQDFFSLSAGEVHYLVCDCHYSGTMTSGAVARRIQAVSAPNPIVRAWRMLRTP